MRFYPPMLVVPAQAWKPTWAVPGTPGLPPPPPSTIPPCCDHWFPTWMRVAPIPKH